MNVNNRYLYYNYFFELSILRRMWLEGQSNKGVCKRKKRSLLNIIWPSIYDMVINIKKACCLRIGSRCNVSCANISIQDGRLCSWISELRYMTIFIVRSHAFKLSLVCAKRSFHLAVNSLF